MVAAARDEREVEGRIDRHRLVDQDLGFLDPVLVEIEDRQIGVGNGIVGVEFDRALEAPLPPRDRPRARFGQLPIAFQIVVDAGRDRCGTRQIGKSAFQIAFDSGLVVSARFERGRVVGIDGKRSVDGRLRLLAVIDEKRQLRAVGRQGRIVRIARLGPLDDLDRCRNILEEPCGPGFRKRRIRPAAGKRGGVSTRSGLASARAK